MAKHLTNWKLWLRGLIAAGISGAANAVTVGIVDPQNFNLQEGLNKLLGVAGVSALVGVALYLKESPIPSDEGK